MGAMKCDCCGQDQAPEKFKPRTHGPGRYPTCRRCVEGSRVIRCQECGRPRRTWAPGRTKYCHFCALIRTFETFKGTTRKCWVCPKLKGRRAPRFAPLGPNDHTCAKHSPPRRRSYLEECKACGTEAQLHSADVRVCLPCLKDPDKRASLYRALLTKREEHTHAVPS